jgi:hypothetical protein
MRTRHTGGAGKKAGKQAATSSFARGARMKLKEARMILNVKPDSTRKEIKERYDSLSKANNEDDGGSFYLRSKVFRAKEALDAKYRAKRRKK